jgi:hypothetical protein
MKTKHLFLGLASLLYLSSCEKDPCEEQLKANCACAEIYSPVCGCNGVTYDNACEAECHGIIDYTSGACE